MMRFKLLLINLVAFIFATLSHASTNQPYVNGWQKASNQSNPCKFNATVVRITRIETPLPPANQLKGYLIDNDPKWELDLNVQEIDMIKPPFQPGLRKFGSFGKRMGI